MSDFKICSECDIETAETCEGTETCCAKALTKFEETGGVAFWSNVRSVEREMAAQSTVFLQPASTCGKPH